MEGIIISDYDDKKFCKLLVVGADGSREIYEASANGFVKVLEFAAPSQANHTHSNTGVTGTYKIGTHDFRYVNGVLVEVTN
jgi:hypothetical protein